MSWRPVERAKRDHHDDSPRPSLTAVLDHYDVQYSPTKRRQMIRCPFNEHDDHTPSCSLDLNKELLNCMSCGKAGDVYTLIEIRENCDFRGALAVAATITDPAGGAGRTNRGVSEPAHRWGGGVATGKGDRPRGGGWRPAWRGR